MTPEPGTPRCGRRMSAPLVFMDTETTGLALTDDIWEFAAIRREPDGTETELHLFIEHDRAKCARLPESFRTDHYDRYRDHRALGTSAASYAIWKLFEGDEPAHVVGAVPNFDTERIARLHRAVGNKPNWYYHLIDVENLAVGYLARELGLAIAGGDRKTATRLRDLIMPPYRSDDLAAELRVTITAADRHTAMGDARWAMRIYDAVMGGAA